MRFDFDGKIEKEVLENYLSRCATAAGLYQSETLSDDLRVIKKLGIKFLGSTRRSFCRRACLR